MHTYREVAWFVSQSNGITIVKKIQGEPDFAYFLFAFGDSTEGGPMRCMELPFWYTEKE